MKTIIVANPKAAAGKVAKGLVRYENAVTERFGECELRLSSKAGGISELVREALHAEPERLVVIGGDGTVNETINGLVNPVGGELYDDLPALLFLPAGTGGDFARSIGTAGLSPEQMFEKSFERPVDVGVVELIGHDGEPCRHYFMNIASLGVSARIAQLVNSSSKIMGGKLAFFKGTIAGLLSWRDRRIRLRVDDHYDEQLRLSCVAIGNGRFFGGGMMVVPGAIVDDGLFDVVIMQDLGAIRFLTSGVYKGRHLDEPGVSVVRGKTVRAQVLDDRGELPVEMDGEHPGSLPLTCRILPGAVRITAPWDDACAVESLSGTES